MKRLTTLVLVAAGLFSAAASAGDDTLYTTRLQGDLAVGQDGTLTLEITPASGYKWNQDYPAKMELANGKTVAFTKTVLKKAEGDITGDDKVGKVTLKAKGTAAGTETITGTMSFSLCNAETCQVLRQRPIPLAVTVK